MLAPQEEKGARAGRRRGEIQCLAIYAVGDEADGGARLAEGSAQSIRFKRGGGVQPGGAPQERAPEELPEEPFTQGEGRLCAESAVGGDGVREAASAGGKGSPDDGEAPESVQMKKAGGAEAFGQGKGEAQRDKEGGAGAVRKRRNAHPGLAAGLQERMLRVVGQKEKCRFRAETGLGAGELCESLGETAAAGPAAGRQMQDGGRGRTGRVGRKGGHEKKSRICVRF